MKWKEEIFTNSDSDMRLGKAEEEEEEEETEILSGFWLGIVLTLR